jgi:Ca2+-binding RTX toxin-like protein
LNAIAAATAGTVTATISGIAADLDNLTASGTTATQALTITVDDAVTAAQGALIAAATNSATVDFSAAGVSDAFGSLASSGALTSNLSSIVNKDADVDVTITSGTADAASLLAIDNATTGTLNLSALTQINGRASDIEELVQRALADPTNVVLPENFGSVISVESSGNVAVSDVITIALNNGNGAVSFGNGITVEGTGLEFLAATADSTINFTNNVNFVAVGDVSVDAAVAMNSEGKGTGTITYNVVDSSDAFVYSASQQTALTAATSVTVNGNDTPNTINLSFFTLNNVTINGLEAADAIYGTAGNDIINGGDGADQLFGRAGNDTIDGGAGNDIITGGAGDDDLTGGTGADIFIFAATSNGLDTIRDFNASEGDILDLAAIITGGAYNTSGTAILDGSTSAIALADVNNKFVYFQVADVTSATIDEASLFAPGAEFAAEGTTAGVEFILAVGEATGTNAVKLYQVTDGAGVDDMAITQIALLGGNSLADLLTANLYVN